MMDLKGKFNHRMIKKAQFGPMHFDDGMNFVSIETDKITGQVSLELWLLERRGTHHLFGSDRMSRRLS